MLIFRHEIVLLSTWPCGKDDLIGCAMGGEGREASAIEGVRKGGSGEKCCRDGGFDRNWIL